MADLIYYVDPAAAGTGDGSSWTNAYTSLNAAEAAHRQNLTSTGNTITFECRCSGAGADTTTVSFGAANWTTDATHYITINVSQANRHTGIRGTGYRIIKDVAWTTVLSISVPYTKVVGVAASNPNAHTDGVIGANALNCTIEDCLVYDATSVNLGGGIYTGNSGNGCRIINCLVYNCYVGISIANNSTNIVYNCTILNSGTYGIFKTNTTNGATYKNLYVGGSTTADYHTTTSTGVITYVTCHSSDGTGTTTTTSVANCHFTSSTLGSENAHIASNSSLKDVATDLHADATYAFNTDFEGTTRPNGAWDIGADEVAITTYTVTYNGNGNTSGSVPTDGSSPYNSGSTVTVLGNTGSLVKTGYKFSSWNTATNGTGTTYAAASTFTISGDTILYAQWTKKRFVLVELD
jgi:parallel beta-helix repeat protein